MRFLYLGDIVGRSGRKLALEQVPLLRDQLRLDFVVANGENAAAGFGITEKIAQELFAAGVDVITTGNHVWDQKETLGYINSEKRLIRPINFPKGTPGMGAGVFELSRGRKALIINAMGRIFMDPLDDPFACVEAELSKHRLGVTVQFILVDIHGEATSEKMAMGHFCDGRVSLVVGSHSHVPTADAQILDGGTAYQTDAGMCGDYNSVIGMDKAEPLQRFTRKIATARFTPALGPATLCGVFVETDDKTGLARRIEPLRLGARLHEHLPTG
ncbi:TIGR00282 family metallophosphoesterase [Luteithermobacter gelatinilyticus]|uniref:TIGR00282 family metallophosphoesterase n=1 Tax=Luteithermobacter gelatinilyticus TaxID=2582913 RepID=UPI0011058827|nr:TIGR00282 family metallophosphoesterase [Luteithermobacter gelatinilyticus]